MVTPIAETATKAADVISRRGWTQGNFVSQTGTVCLLGAINAALGFSPHGIDTDEPNWVNANAKEIEIYEALYCHLEDELGQQPELWNDRPETCMDDVLDLLRTVTDE